MTSSGSTLLADRYALEELLATGGSGEVWRARDLLLDRSVAVKVLKPEHADAAEARDRLRAEARHTQGLEHPGIASVYDAGEQGGSGVWLVMELVEGEPLSVVLARGPLGVDATLDVVAQTARALQAAHERGVVHRDVKPGNLVLRPDGTVKVTDFGIAHAAGAPADSVAGTPYYLAPEQAAGGPVTGATDVYALGVVAYESLTGRRPFPGTDPEAIAAAHRFAPPPPLPDAVPERVRDLVLSALAKDPADRPASAGELARTAEALRARLAEPEAAPARPGGRHRRALALAGALVVVAAGAAGARAFLAPADGARSHVEPSTSVGQPFAEVRDRLTRAGLLPLPAYDGSGQAPGTVSDLEPAGDLVQGTRVTVHVVPVPTTSS